MNYFMNFTYDGLYRVSYLYFKAADNYKAREIVRKLVKAHYDIANLELKKVHLFRRESYAMSPWHEISVTGEPIGVTLTEEEIAIANIDSSTGKENSNE